MLDGASFRVPVEDFVTALWWDGAQAGIIGADLTGTPEDYRLSAIYFNKDEGEVRVDLQRVP